MNEHIERLCATPAPDIGFPMRLIGGAVRDALLGVESKDLDFVVEAPDFPTLIAAVEAAGGKVFDIQEKTLTVRAQVPGTQTLDYVLAREDGPYSDGRHPDWTRPATFVEDAMRRDFTVNALGLDLATGEIHDYCDGINDLAGRYLRFVGVPMDRIREDALRVVRALRFTVCKGFFMPDETWNAVNSYRAAEMVKTLPVERIRPELERMFQHNTIKSIGIISEFGHLRNAMFRDGLRLAATVKEKSVNR